jgi:hypothetical protein
VIPGPPMSPHTLSTRPDKKKVTMVQQLNEEYGDDAVVYVTRKKPRDGV